METTRKNTDNHHYKNLLTYKKINCNNRFFWLYISLLLIFNCIIIYWPSGLYDLISQYGVFFLLGMAGALVANATGAGGGVIFIPFFTAFGFSPIQSVATSMAIQCFGMTAGSLSWLLDLSKRYQFDHRTLQQLKKLLLITGLSTILGVLSGQYFFSDPAWAVASIFKIVSISFGIILLIYAFTKNAKTPIALTELNALKIASAVPVCFIGGIITSWISIGVGELAALLLFFLGVNAKIAVAIGVYTSSISVLTGVIKYIFVDFSVSIEVVLFAAQAALVGGFFAKYITKFLGDFYLKLFFAIWIIGTALLMK
ncbi:MAG: sulfite exporter TauE/SafE family protein [Cellvibrionaceae bacterium]|nr:sulfite exporter TauE/SafE family protein [Cellvibrionaceae bacterium]